MEEVELKRPYRKTDPLFPGKTRRGTAKEVLKILEKVLRLDNNKNNKITHINRI